MTHYGPPPLKTKNASSRVCPKCKSRATKILHLSADEKPYECQICGHRYSLQSPETPTRVQSVIGEIEAELRRFRSEPFGRLEIVALQFKLDLLNYLITPVEAYEEKYVRPPARFCAVDEGCDHSTLYHVGDEWRCLKHIPEHILNPIGLWGEERKATGRK